MKKIDGLLDNFELQDEEINIVENNMTKEEMDRIKKLTITKAGFKQNKRYINRRFIIPLAAVMTLVFSFAVVFAQGGLNSIYNKLFGDNTKYVNEMGTVINKSYSSNGITLNVSSMLGEFRNKDKLNLIIIICI